ncbi:MAG: multiheme c-type cytochrome [Candidatus Polarisedimenticolia bacterium]
MLDTGDFSGEANEPGRIKTQNLIEGMGKIGYDVVNVGERDLAGSVADFISSVVASGLTVTSASLIYRDTGEPVFAPYGIKSYKTSKGLEVKIGYVGLDAFNSAFTREGPGGRVVIMRTPAEALKQIVPALRRRVNLIVLLANLGTRDLQEALEAAPGVDLALASFAGRISPAGALETVGGTRVLYAGDQGKRMGEVRITFAKDPRAPVMTSGHVWLTRRYPSDPALQTLIDQTIARVNDANRRLAQSRVTPVPAPAGGGASRAGGPPTSPAQPSSVRKPFLTSTACQSCHGEAYRVYENSAHAHAFQTLREAKQDYNPECVSCHVTGFHEPEGFVDAHETPGLMNVQCEACHGNAAEHIRDPQKEFGAVPPRRCFGCHTKENSPDFVFYKYWNQIKH